MFDTWKLFEDVLFEELNELKITCLLWFICCACLFKLFNDWLKLIWEGNTDFKLGICIDCFGWLNDINPWKLKKQLTWRVMISSKVKYFII